MFGFAASESRTLAGFRHSYNSIADEMISYDGFYHRLMSSLTEYIRHLVETGLNKIAMPGAVDSEADRFKT